MTCRAPRTVRGCCVLLCCVSLMLQIVAGALCVVWCCCCCCCCCCVCVCVCVCVFVLCVLCVCVVLWCCVVLCGVVFCVMVEVSWSKCCSVQGNASQDNNHFMHHGAVDNQNNPVFGFFFGETCRATLGEQTEPLTVGQGLETQRSGGEPYLSLPDVLQPTPPPPVVALASSAATLCSTCSDHLVQNRFLKDVLSHQTRHTRLC